MKDKEETKTSFSVMLSKIFVIVLFFFLIAIVLGCNTTGSKNSSRNKGNLTLTLTDSVKINLPNPDTLLAKAKAFFQEGKLNNTKLTLKQIIYYYKDPKDSVTVAKANEFLKKVDEAIFEREEKQKLPMPESKNIIIAEEKGNQDVPKSYIHKFKSEKMVMTVNELSVPFDIVSYHTIDFTNKKVVIQINEDYDKPNYTRFNIVSESTTKSGNSVIATLNLSLIGSNTREQELINKLVFSTSLGTLFYSGNGSLITYGQLSVVE